jgi:xanthine dehydrogenase accessory factor
VKSGVVLAVLAAGGSRRLGRPKQLVDVRGKPLVRHVVDALTTSACEAFAVVVGASERSVTAALDGAPVVALRNEAWAQGIASSIRVATTWAMERSAPALVLALADQPLLDAAHVDRLVEAWSAARSRPAAVASIYAGVLAVPALFDASVFASLLALEGDRGASRLLRGRAHVVGIEWTAGEVDVDTESDARALGASIRTLADEALC